jgi:choline dehydrogenase
VREGDGFDYVVVGAGSAGCAVVDAILAKNPSASVLVLEAGLSNDVPIIHDFRQAMKLRGTIYDWNDKSQNQTCMDSRPVPYDAGKVDGGGSSINGMVWVRGNSADYDAWAQENPGWDANSVLEVFIRQETYGPGGSPLRGSSGPIYVTNELSINPVSVDFVSALTALGYPFNPDYNAANQFGVVYSQLNVRPEDGGGLRQDAYSAFVEPKLGSSDVVVVNSAQVQGVTFDATNTVAQVWFEYGGDTYSVAPQTETILCGGALRSPQLLMLSGIGDAGALKALGIDVVVDLPGVGQNLQDQVITFVVWSLAKTDPTHITVMDNNVFIGADSSSVPEYEIQTFYMTANPTFEPNSFAVGAISLHPTSRGSISLQSSSYLVPPLIQPNLLCSPDDLQGALAGVKLARTIANEFAANSTWLGAENMPGSGVVTDAELIAYIQKTALPDFHCAGTCKMGPASDPAAVVGPDLTVHGVNGLRVADASIMPTVPSGNTNAPSIMIGGMAGELIAGRP